ncbi:type II secretion system F family protein [Paenibacillus sp. YYML68]|uniref:type II secretion system F family protein n=1 Tax=Paenibacillus sp. YYML68 TaxID=2909250 RepID=UPI002490AF46|nr:type II secretion system F family protein [Paenibacillus sp. YYML68]
MSWMLLVFALQLVVAAVWLPQHHKYAHWLFEQKGIQPRTAAYWAGAGALAVSERLRLTERFGEPLLKVHQIMVGLYGAKPALTHTTWFVVRGVWAVWGCLAGFTLLGALAEDNAEMLVYGLLAALVSPVALFLQEQTKLKQKRRLMLMELPEVLNQLMLLVGAGESLQKAIVRLGEQDAEGGTAHSGGGKNRSRNPLRVELAETARALAMNVSFSKAMEDFSKRCAIQETTLFTTTLLLNYKRGGDELFVSLRELSMTLWDKRKALARTLGEEAASKLVFPMVVLFMMIMIIVAVPALLMAG